MKAIWVIWTILFSFASCGFRSETGEANENIEMNKMDVFDDTLPLGNSINIKVLKPQLLKTGNFNPESEFMLRNYFYKSEKYKSVIIEELNDLCASSYLAILKDTLIFNLYCIKNQCNTDLSRSYYEYYDFIIQNDSIIQIVKHTEKVANKQLVDASGFIKNGKSRDEVTGLLKETFKYQLNLSKLGLTKKKWPLIIYPPYK